MVMMMITPQNTFASPLPPHIPPSPPPPPPPPPSISLENVISTMSEWRERAIKEEEEEEEEEITYDISLVSPPPHTSPPRSNSLLI
ncbi:hypothetical protein E2C01_086777 [Portunus trituberculatus]|uniref:Uncharacterized protein n=1 Tax=Portunus trituberculatus TaxID=210409 RepID=A0A5B7J1R4_PORTR|nr:hypothetical protein [Portunus trituberculatus]